MYIKSHELRFESQLVTSERGGEMVGSQSEWGELYQRLSDGANEMGTPLGEEVGDTSMWNVPWSASETADLP